MMSENTTQGIWINVRDSMEITGLPEDDLKRLAQTQLALLEAERDLKVRQRGARYEFWLPDLVKYMKTIR